MRSDKPGQTTSDPGLAVVSPHGFWLVIRGASYFLAYEHFPWFGGATEQQLRDVQLLHGTHLYWPALDVDLSIEIRSDPERYPLVSRRAEPSGQAAAH